MGNQLIFSLALHILLKREVYVIKLISAQQ
jgi:hypothetical protein